MITAVVIILGQLERGKKHLYAFYHIKTYRHTNSISECILVKILWSQVTVAEASPKTHGRSAPGPCKEWNQSLKSHPEICGSQS